MQLQIQFEGNASAAMFSQFPDALRRAIERGLERATELLERAVAAAALSPFGARSGAPLGELARSLKREVFSEGGQDNVRAVGRVFLGAPADQYGIFVEVGTRPHFPPPAAIESWVRRRLGVTNDRQARELAFLIGRKIARTGTPGRFLFERALEENVDRVVAILEEEVAQAVSGE
ncbi:MAG: hypothetical protein ACRD88_10330 [Terriglobia bacterium]